MIAREMFKSLGYKYCEESDERYNYKVIKYYDTIIEFVFSINSREFAVSYCEEPKYITVDEFKAILKQMEELGWLEEEKQEIKQETNFEHYKDEILDNCFDSLAVVNGSPKLCYKTSCNNCDFKLIQKECHENVMDWLKQPYEKPTYQLNQFEFDLLQINSIKTFRFKNINALTLMKEKGYFKDVDEDETIEEILDNCEVTK